MRYYRLRDNVSFPGRWVLDDPVTDRGCDPSDFTLGKVALVAEPTVEVQEQGLALAFSMTLREVPIVTTVLAERIASVARHDVQRIPVRVGARTGYEILNALRVINAIDETMSEFKKWTAADGRPDKVGEYRSILPLWVDPHRVPPDAHVFRLQGWLIALVVSQTLKEAMEEVGCVGAQFLEIT